MTNPEQRLRRLAKVWLTAVKSTTAQAESLGRIDTRTMTEINHDADLAFELCAAVVKKLAERLDRK